MNFFERAFVSLNGRGYLRFIPDELCLKILFRIHFHRSLDLDNPKTFNEKLQWLKLYDRKPFYPRMVDKYEAKKYVAERIGEEYIIPTYGVWDHFEDIDFDSLPNQFVLKCTHDSGGLVICKDKNKLDLASAKRKIEGSLRHNYFWAGREWPYKSVKPRIIAEKYMEDSETAELRDYKFFCFGGIAKCYKIDFDRFIEHHANYYSPDGKLLDIGETCFPPLKGKEISIPNNIDLMRKLGEHLAEETPFLRADFYDVDGKIFFGELTFFPASGFGEFISEDSDGLLGKWINLPDQIGGDMR